MTISLKPIETNYNGYKFRSRLEARWAVFFDSLGIEYQYEAEGYDLKGTYYLPDFWLPQQDCFIEIKGEKPTPEEERKAGLLSIASNKNVFIFFGQIPYSTSKENDGAYLYSKHGWDNYYSWCECFVCHKLGIEFEGRSARLACGCAKKNDPTADRDHNPKSSKLVKAYFEAQQARFEFGQTPKPGR